MNEDSPLDITFLRSDYYNIKLNLLLVAESQPREYMTRRIVPIPERLVRCIWFDQRLNKKKLRTIDGLPVTVYSQGEWNSGGGPDFSEAMLQIGDADPVQGPVEIHVRSSDWKRHGHQNNREFRDVLLNVSMWHDDYESSAINDLDEAIPHVELCDAIEYDLDELAAHIDMENYPFASQSRVGLCHRHIKGREQNLQRLLEIAGQERLLIKARRIWRYLEKYPFGHVLYGVVMESMGYRPNKKPFRALARCVPADLVARISAENPPDIAREILEALLLGASGLFSNISMNIWDQETNAYCEMLGKHWKQWEQHLRRPFLKKKDWTLRGVRPANFPLRRMAAAAGLFARINITDMEQHIVRLGRDIKNGPDAGQARRLLSDMCDLIVQPAQGYWEHRMTPGGKIMDTVPALLGKAHAMSVILNIFLPLLICRSVRETDEDLRRAVMNFFAMAPRLDMHQITRLMRYRIWGDPAGGATLMRREIIQQGLLQIFFDFCDENVRDCRRCQFPKLLKLGPELPFERPF